MYRKKAGFNTPPFFFSVRMDMIMTGLGKIKKVLVENLIQQKALSGDEAKAA